MSKHTSMQVGGPATVYFETEDELGLVHRVRAFYRAGMPYLVIGNGTNVIVLDGGFPGAVFSTQVALKGIKLLKNDPEAPSRILCGAGESLARVCRYAADHGLTGMEALAGIPGTIGGAVYMNAGAYDRDMSDAIVRVRAYDVRNDKVIMLTNDECCFGYRSSVFKDEVMSTIRTSGAYIILATELVLEHGKRSEIEAKTSDFLKRRNEKQPMDQPSSGSFFKRPAGDYAGRLIEAAGMKGARVGGAQVSEKHAGFIVNTGGATAADIMALAEEIKVRVYDMSKIMLEEEPIVVGI